MKLLHAGIQDRKPWAAERNLDYLMNAHRLDFETSGVLLLAKDKPALVQLANAFGSDRPLKKYVALVRGTPPEDTLDLDRKLAPHPTRVGIMRVDSRRGKRSHTVVRVLERFSGYTLLECEPVTGRTHQIRVHLQYAGLPIVGDSVYGGGASLFLSRLKKNYTRKPGVEERPLIDRVALHAEHLQLSHPVTGEPLAISAPWPKDLMVSVKYLRRYACHAA
jgi:RluA family pseudouridine synthase